MSSKIVAIILSSLTLVGFPPQEIPILEVTQVKEERVIVKSEIIDRARQVAHEYQISEELFINILLKESGASSTVRGDMKIICKQGVNKGKPVEARGLFQITKCHHPDITDEQAFDIEFSLAWAARQFQRGRVDLWTSWRLIK
jgi:hypothetical protein